MKINHAILHILDFDSAVNVMSQRELDIESRTVRNFVTTHLRRVRTSADNKRATFAENSAFGGELKGYFFGEREFVDLSQQIAEFISSELTKAEKAESTDVLVADFDDDEDARWFAAILLGSKQAFMHEVGREGGRCATTSRATTPFCQTPRKRCRAMPSCVRVPWRSATWTRSALSLIHI